MVEWDIRIREFYNNNRLYLWMALFFIIGIGIGSSLFYGVVSITDVIQAFTAVVIAYLAIQQMGINKSQLELTLESLKPRIVVRSEGYRAIYVENAGIKPVFNVKLFARTRKSLNGRLDLIGETRLLRPETPLKVGLPEEWKQHLLVMDYIVNFSVEQTGKMDSISGFILLKEPVLSEEYRGRLDSVVPSQEDEI